MDNPKCQCGETDRRGEVIEHCAACRIASFKAMNSGSSERGAWSEDLTSVSGVESYTSRRELER
jgi:hypothetical protein